MKTLLAFIFIASQAFAGIQYESYTIPVNQRAGAVRQFGFPATTNFEPSIPIVVPPFNPSNGTLVKVEMFFNYSPTWVYRAENDHPTLPTPTPPEWMRVWQMNVVYRPFTGCCEWNGRNTVGNTFPAGEGAQGSWPFILSPYDGVTDWTGTSGFTKSYGNSGLYTKVVTLLIDASEPLELWYWSQPTTKTIYVCPRMNTEWVTGFPTHGWPHEDSIAANLGGSVTIWYTYQ